MVNCYNSRRRPFYRRGDPSWIPPNQRFPLLLKTSLGWQVFDRGCLRPYLARLYLVPECSMLGRYWVTWSTNLGRFINDSNFRRLVDRWPARVAHLERELRAHLVDAARSVGKAVVDRVADSAS